MESRRRVREVVSDGARSKQLSIEISSSTSGGCFSHVRRCSIVALCVVLFIWAYPSPIDPVSFQYSSEHAPEMVGPLAINDLLKQGERLFENELIGPEALVISDEGEVYTGLGDGRIIRFSKDLKSFSTILRTGIDSERCGKVASAALETICGRPLGMVFSSLNREELYVIDSSLGLLKVNVKTRRMETLVSKNTSSLPINLLNDLVELPNGSLLITDSSLKFLRYENQLEGLECRANGQLLVYHPSQRSLHLVRKGLHFPNGLSLAGDGQSVLLAETTRGRILRYYFGGDKAGTTEVFSENLPGWPDNVSPSSNGGYWVGNAIIRSTLTDVLAQSLVSVRSIIAKFHLLPLLESLGLPPQHGLVLELNSEGKVVRSLHDVGGEMVSTTSHILEHGNTLLIGSYNAPYLFRVHNPNKS